MRVSREINGFINNLVACLSLASFHRRGYRVLNSYYVGGEWKPCRRRQDGRGARVEGVRKGGRGIRYRLKGDSMADFHFWTFFFEPPSFERALASAFSSPPPSKRKKRRNYGRFSSNNLDVISTFDRTLEILSLSSRNDESNGREEKYSGNLFSFSFFSPEKGLEDPRGESILSFVRRKKWQRLIERAK